MKKAERIIRNLIAHFTLVYSALMIFAVLGNSADPDLMYVNATNFGEMLIGYAVCAVLSSVVYFVMRGRYGKKSSVMSEILPHGTVVLSAVMLTLAITNLFNRTMSFVSSELSVSLILIYSVLVLFLAIGNIEYLYAECEK